MSYVREEEEVSYLMSEVGEGLDGRGSFCTVSSNASWV